jgi:hypothetical protein
MSKFGAKPSVCLGQRDTVLFPSSLTRLGRVPCMTRTRSECSQHVQPPTL